MSVHVAALLGDAGAIARRLPGFEPRPQQLQMASAVEECLARSGRLMVEAGTGTGKSFAYLVPAIQRILSHRERVVICTNTIALQEQLIDKDIPLLNAVIPDEFSAVLVKGRGNYVSLRRLRLASERADRLLGSEEERHSLELIEDWAYRTTDGTRSTLPQLPREQVWEHAQSDAGNCLGRRCPNHDACFYQAARRRMENGDLLVCNHALFFSDLALRRIGRGFLPDYQHVILDEAHAIEEVACEHFGARLSESRVAHLLRTLHDSRQHRGGLWTVRVQDGGEGTIQQAILAVDRCREASEAFFGDLWRWHQSAGGAGRVREAGIVGNPLTPALSELAALLALVRERASSDGDAAEVNAWQQRTADMAAAAEALVAQSLSGCVYWVEAGGRRKAHGGARPDVALVSAAVDVGPVLRENLFGREVSVVMTSATLSTRPGDFRHTAVALGCDDPTTLQVGSPFDYPNLVELYLDVSMPEPSSPAYVESLADRVLRHVGETDGGAFVLFTSIDTMHRVAELASHELVSRGHPLHVQGLGVPNRLLIERFRQDERSVLFGVSSFWQGIDVRGRALRNVIITRLPFEVPDLPLVQARQELVQSRGGNAFMDDQLPRAILRFKQGFGRLVRSATDSGRVVVLDPRIATKRYGRLFLDALPEGIEPRIIRAPEPEPLDDGPSYDGPWWD